MASGKTNSTPQAVVIHSVRTTAVAIGSLLVARLCRLPESYWAPITALVITQSSLGAALVVSRQRLVGTVLGAGLGTLAATWFGMHMLVFAGCIFLLGLLCAFTRSGNSAYRFGGVTLAIMLLIQRPGPAWIIGLHRFAEVALGILVALAFAYVWPEPDAAN
jgi:uncharacterized membrane protein YccC